MGKLSVSSVKTLEDAKISPGCLYMQMPVHDVRSLRLLFCGLVLIALSISMAPCSSANSKKYRRKVIMRLWTFSRSGMKKENFRVHILRAKIIQ